MALQKTIKVFIGYDEREAVAYHVLTDSLMTHSSMPLSVTPLRKENLKGLSFDKKDARASNAFSYSRFLVPYLSDYSGTSVYMDCDMLVTQDIAGLVAQAEREKNLAVHVVKHDYKSKVKTKYLGNTQEDYPRKNWSSFVVWNCSHNKNMQINPEFIRSASPSHLHRFLWLNDSEIGALPKEWNWLVGEYPEEKGILPSNVHWTLGGPYFNEYKDVDFSDLWFEQYRKMVNVTQIDEV